MHQKRLLNCTGMLGALVGVARGETSLDLARYRVLAGHDRRKLADQAPVLNPEPGSGQDLA